MEIKHSKLSDQARRRLKAGDLILRGYDNDEIVDILGVCLSSVQHGRKSVEQNGLHALTRKPQSGCPKKLDDAKRKELKKIILQSGFSFVPNCVRTWGRVDHPPMLFETSGRHNHTGSGEMSRSVLAKVKENRNFPRFENGIRPLNCRN